MRHILGKLSGGCRGELTSNRETILVGAVIFCLGGCATPSAARRNATATVPAARIASLEITRTSQDSWLGPDKVKHFFISAFIESLAFSGLQATGAGRSSAFAGAIATMAAFGIAREVHDKRTKGIFSIPDLTWDAAGGGAALLVLRSTQR